MLSLSLISLYFCLSGSICFYAHSHQADQAVGRNLFDYNMLLKSKAPWSVLLLKIINLTQLALFSLPLGSSLVIRNAPLSSFHLSSKTISGKQYFLLSYENLSTTIFPPLDFILCFNHSFHPFSCVVNYTLSFSSLFLLQAPNPSSLNISSLITLIIAIFLTVIHFPGSYITYAP